MNRIACALPLLAGLPSVVAAQVNISLPRLQRPVVCFGRASDGRRHLGRTRYQPSGHTRLESKELDTRHSKAYDRHGQCCARARHR